MNSGRIAVASGKQQPELQVAEEEAVAEEAEMGEGEGRHRREREGERDGEQRDQQRIAEHLPIAVARQDVPVVLPHPDARQAERMRLQIAEFLEAVERGREDRHEHDAGEHDERAKIAMVASRADGDREGSCAAAAVRRIASRTSQSSRMKSRL